jgi:hypothetical protein
MTSDCKHSDTQHVLSSLLRPSLHSSPVGRLGSMRSVGVSSRYQSQNSFKKEVDHDTTPYLIGCRLRTFLSQRPISCYELREL